MARRTADRRLRVNRLWVRAELCRSVGRGAAGGGGRALQVGRKGGCRVIIASNQMTGAPSRGWVGWCGAGGVCGGKIDGVRISFFRHKLA